ncbi:hypothetical protein [Aquabacterium sp.]|uniref:hypothetical protein n=1 Tax=Aquabacterium sp. TaxID=1872578 RepID=UPI0037849E3F
MKLLRRWPVLLLLASALACAAAPVKTGHEAMRLAAAAIDKYELTSLRDECGLLSARETASYFDVDFRERHTPSCGGDPETKPRLFTVRVRKRDGRLTSDVYDGVDFRPLNHKLPRR